MNATRVLRAAHAYTPLIRFKGHHVAPANIDHTPQPHPASPKDSLPDSFAAYRQKSQSHGPLAGHKPASSSNLGRISYGAIGAKSGHDLGAIEAPSGQVFDRSELPERFQRLAWTQGEIDAVESGGASLW